MSLVLFGGIGGSLALSVIWEVLWPEVFCPSLSNVRPVLDCPHAVWTVMFWRFIIA